MRNIKSKKKKYNSFRTKKKNKTFYQQGSGNGSKLFDKHNNLIERLSFFPTEIPYMYEIFIYGINNIIKENKGIIQNPQTGTRPDSGHRVLEPEVKATGIISRKITTNYEDIENYIITVRDNIKSLQEELTNDTLLHDSYLSFFDMHGTVINEDYKVVPENTIICFLSPIDYAISFDNYYKTGSKGDFLSTINNLTWGQYKTLFQFRELIGKTFQNTESIQGHTLFNCFQNSQWYYPGQIYSNLNLTMTYADNRRNHDLDFQYNFFDPVLNGPVKKTLIKELLNKFNYRGPTLDFTEKKTLKLNEFVSYPRPGVTKKYNLVLVPCCRPINNLNQLNKSNCLKLEVLNYHINQSVLSSLPPTETLITGCKLMSNKYYIFKENSSNILFPEYPLIKNLNYNGFIPSLMIIYESIKKGNFQELELKYLASHSPHKILNFILKVKRYLPSQYQTFMEKFIRDANISLVNTLNNYSKFCDFTFLTPINVISYKTQYHTIFQDLDCFLDEIQSLGILDTQPRLQVLLAKFYSKKSVGFQRYLGSSMLMLRNNFDKLPRIDETKAKNIKKIIIYECNNFNLKNLNKFTNCEFLEFKNTNRIINLTLDKNTYLKTLIIDYTVNISQLYSVLFKLFPSLEKLHISNHETSETLDTSIITSDLKILKLVNTQLSVTRFDMLRSLQELHLEKNPRLMNMSIQINPQLNAIHLADNNNLTNLHLLGIGVLKDLNIVGGKNLKITNRQVFIENLKMMFLNSLDLKNPGNILNLEIDNSILTAKDLDYMKPKRSLIIKNTTITGFDISKLILTSPCETITLENIEGNTKKIGIAELTNLQCNNLNISLELLDDDINISQIRGKNINILHYH